MGNMSMPLHNMTMPHHGNMTMPKPYNGTHIHAPSCTCPTRMRTKPKHGEPAKTPPRNSRLPHKNNGPSTRSDARSVGKEWEGTCGDRWWPNHEKKNNNKT